MTDVDGLGEMGLLDGGVAELHSILLELDQLKRVARQNPIAVGERQETTAEHSWHLAVAVILLARFAAEPVDVHRAVALAVTHDIPEVFVGDTFVYSPEIEDRHGNETTVMKRFQAEHDTLPEIRSIVVDWADYENGESPEGRFVMALDVLLPVFLNYANLKHSSWIRHNVRADQVRDRIDSVRAACPAMADLAAILVDRAVAQSVLRESDDGQ